MPELSISVRRGTVDDVARVAAIWSSGWRDGHLGGVPAALVAARGADYFPKRAALQVPQTTVAIVNEGVAGFIMVAGDELEQIYVAREYRGRRVAQVLLREAERQIAAAGFREAWLAVVASNERARAFYAREGWSDDGPFDYNAYADGGPIRVPAHRYVKRVSAARSTRQALHGRVAVVAGATRGAGRGIAAALGEAAATVICTGRSSRMSPIPSDYTRPETIEETADLVTTLGGKGIPVAVDHLDPEHVQSLAVRIREEYGHISILVNNIWGAELLKGGPARWDRPIWDHDLADGLRILRLGIDSHLITCYQLLPLLVQKPHGLLVEVTDGTASYNATHYRLSVFYDLVKTSVSRLAFSFGHELVPHQATAVAITPGWLRSEMMLENFGVSEMNWRDALVHGRPGNLPTAPPDFALSESPLFVGRAVVALATDPNHARWNAKTVSSGDLAAEYGFTDVDGSRPNIWRFIEHVREAGREASYDDYR